MPRTARSVTKRARHKKWLQRAKGFRGRRRTVFKLAKEASLKAGQYAYRDRRKKKAQFRQRWQGQINAAARQHGTTYSRLIGALNSYGSQLDRKVLATLANEHPAMIKEIIEKTRPKSS
ncbi:MAG: 50S ribosomal protein L20 [Candidatus Andersenbacteria bacterium CG10_big_fil_rev_8_21_14_0_10_54_11]|uniref:Large ribosomal subunit protein bL20 n=1 Tax=Candidatus Andersenbacteria bacterium CG10_big_fil_rev_8_21_14_0_10_54_11 TaxID=1974485 RepID=A0A2M6X0G8_9BACT|nr:MAG: 50S ribosomal protein L20 [Candidatus Andersenbacteria bacterium CG10_big_fil_rev_8_21_14_0_10_54_11]